MSGSGRSKGSGAARPGRRRGLLLRFLLILTPLFLVLAVPGVGGLVFYALHNDKEALAVRFGNHAGRVAAALARHDPAADTQTAQDLVSTLASDRALICAELFRGEGATRKLIVAHPPGFGCRGRKDGLSLEIPVGDDGAYFLAIRFSDAEIRHAQRVQMFVAISVIALSFILAVLTSMVGFRLIVGRPLGLLLRAIEKSANSGERPLVRTKTRDELATVITAFNEMQIRDTEREAALTVANEQLRKSQAELEAWNSELEKAVGERTAELEMAVIKAEAASRSMSQFLASMSHELRTPLNSIIGFSELMLRKIYGPLGSDRYAEFSGDIHNSGKHLLKIVNEILDLAKIEAGTMELYEEVEDAGSLLESCLRLVRPAAETKGIALDTRIEGADLLLSVDTTKFRQALINLLSNAIKFTPEGGSVSLTTRRDADGGISFIVADTGIGMLPEEIPIALATFGQVDRTLARKYEGTGLGLPLAKQFIELHGGRLHMESAPGEGTRATLTLPPARVGDRGSAREAGSTAAI